MDSPLVVWGGRIMFTIGMFGWSLVPLFFLGINLTPGFLHIKEDGILGLGAIIGATFGGIGAAFVFKTRAYKIWKKERAKSHCKSVQETGYHDWKKLIDKALEKKGNIEVPMECKVCGETQKKLYSESYYQ